MFAVPPLEALVRAGHEVSLVVTQPDRPKGRGMELALSPVKQKAIELGLPIAQPEKIKNNAEFRAQLEATGAGVHCDRRLWAHHSALDARPASAWQHQPARLAAAEISRSRTDSVGHCIGRTGDRQHHHAHRRRTGYGRHSAARGDGDSPGRHECDAGSAAGGDGSRAAGGDLASAGGAERTGHAAGSCAGDSGADSDARRWTHRLCARHGADDLQSASRLSAVAGSIHQLSRQAAYAACDLVIVGAPALMAGEIAAAGEKLLAGCGAGTAIAIDELQLEGKRRMSAREFINGYQPKAGEKLGE